MGWYPVSISSPPPLVAVWARHPMVDGSKSLKKLSVVRTSKTRPIVPSSISALARATAGRKSWLWAHMSVTPALSTASVTSRASSAERQSGFSHRMCLPARAAATIASLCRWWGRQMSTASTSGSASSSW